MIKYLVSAVMITVSAVAMRAANENPRVVVYDSVATQVTAAGVTAVSPAASDLWITTSELTRATRFVIKAQGVCRDQLCFPLPKSRKAAFLVQQGSATWFNLSEFARLIKQPFAFDQKNGVWYFGARTAEQNGYLASLEAPRA